MANDFDDFNYDPDDPELDENGLPKEEDDGASLDELMDYIRSLQDEEEDDEVEEDDDDDSFEDNSSNRNREKNDKDADTSSKSEKSEGGRYGDKTSPSSKSQLTTHHPASQPTPKPSGGDNWFSKFSNFGKGGGAGGVGAKAGGKVAGQAATKAGGAAAKAFAAIGPYGWLAILIILVIIILVVAIVAVVAYFDEKTDPANMGNNTIITSEYFYGTRSVYIDEGILTKELQLSYKQYVIDIVENFEENNPSVDITIELPQLAETEILTNETIVDENITNLSLGIANIVATGSSEYSNVDFTTLYPQIPYFGLSAEQNEIATNFIVGYIANNSLYSTQDESLDVENLIEITINTDADLQYILNRAEKVMIKDEIATQDGISGVEIHQYIASIYMPNKDIIIESASYIISSTDEVFSATSKLIEENNGDEIVQREKETTDNRDLITGFISGNITVEKFTSIDENNTRAFSAGISLFGAMRLSPEYKHFFTLNANGIYTWKPTSESLYYLTFDAETPFIFTDYDMNIKTY